MRYKKVLFLTICIAMICIFGGCGNSNKSTEDTTKSNDTTAAIHAGEDNIYLDEAMYYAYTAQATYETYYLAEGKELDWSSKVKDGISMETLVKSTVLDDICRRQCMYDFGVRNNIVLTSEEKKDIEIKLENYYEQTKGELLSKIGICRERLSFVFEKQAIAKKAESVLETSEKKLADETYKKWKEENTVTAEEQWETITFSKPIFTLEDMN